MSRQKYVMGNWKMNGNKQTIHALLQHIKTFDVNHVVVFPPYLYIEKTAWELRNSKIKLGAQNVCAYLDGAYTGEISASMLKDIGCEYVLIGHSERREYFNETNEIILEKFLQAVKVGLKPVLCVGETLEEKQAHRTKQKVLAQLESVLKCKAALPYLSQLIIAYEPVWAIGTGLTASAQEAQGVHNFIRDVVADIDKNLALEISILYGGSVKASNAKQLFAMPDIDGGLIGGASLIGEEFKEICHAQSE